MITFTDFLYITECPKVEDMRCLLCAESCQVMILKVDHRGEGCHAPGMHVPLYISKKSVQNGSLIVPWCSVLDKICQ